MQHIIHSSKLVFFRWKQVFHPKWVLCALCWKVCKLTPIFWSDGNFFLTTFILFLAFKFHSVTRKIVFPSIDTRLRCVCSSSLYLLFYYYVLSLFLLFFSSNLFYFLFTLEKCVCCAMFCLNFHFGFVFGRFSPKSSIEAIVSISYTHIHYKKKQIARHDVKGKKKI